MKIPKDITMTEFIQKLTMLRDEVERYESGKIDGNHDMKSHVHFAFDNPDNDKIEHMEVDEIELDTLLGCMCPCGITIWLKREK